jgi:hypothetical protein
MKFGKTAVHVGFPVWCDRRQTTVLHGGIIGAEDEERVENLASGGRVVGDLRNADAAHLGFNAADGG